MIDYKLINTNVVNTASTKIYLRDSTVYTGDERKGLAILIRGVYKHSKGDRIVSFDNYDATTANTFNAITTNDGWYQFDMYSVPLLDEALVQTYNVGDTYYFAKDDTLVLIQYFLGFKVAAKIDGDIDNKFLVSSIDAISVASNTRVMLRINSSVSNLLTNNVDTKNRRLVRLKDNYNIVRTIIQGSIYEFARGNKSVCQKNLEFLSTNDYTKV